MISAAIMAEDAATHKAKGNQCMKEEKYIEAVINYTFAVKLDPESPELRSNRSLAFLKSQQYYFALEDADKAIKLKPDWPKGYYRKAEVFFNAKHFEEALYNYQRAKELHPQDSALHECIKKTKAEMQNERKTDFQVPWLGAASGLLVGIGLALIMTNSESSILKNPFLLVAVAILVSAVGYGIGKLYRRLMKSHYKSFLEDPGDIFNERETNEVKKTTPPAKKPIIRKKNK